MKTNRMYWIKKINKMNRRLNKLSNAISSEKRIFIDRFITIIDYFEDELRDWKIDLRWINEIDKGNTNMDLKSYKMWCKFT